MARNKKNYPEGLAIPAGLFIGMGIGFLTGNLVAWMFIGLGVGFLFSFLSKLKKKR
jgi:predicted ABC-type sugar transport system permease subunit